MVLAKAWAKLRVARELEDPRLVELIGAEVGLVIVERRLQRVEHPVDVPGVRGVVVDREVDAGVLAGASRHSAPTGSRRSAGSARRRRSARCAGRRASTSETFVPGAIGVWSASVETVMSACRPAAAEIAASRSPPGPPASAAAARRQAVLAALGAVLQQCRRGPCRSPGASSMLLRKVPFSTSRVSSPRVAEAALPAPRLEGRASRVSPGCIGRSRR